MYSMSNEEIIRAHEYHEKSVSILKQELAELESLKKHIAVLTKSIKAAESVSYIHKGVPMSEMGGPRIYYIYATSNYVERWAYIYRSANNNRRWGLTLRHIGNDHGGKCMGAMWKTKKACVKAAKEWIATGTKSEEHWR